MEGLPNGVKKWEFGREKVKLGEVFRAGSDGRKIGMRQKSGNLGQRRPWRFGRGLNRARPFPAGNSGGKSSKKTTWSSRKSRFREGKAAAGIPWNSANPGQQKNPGNDKKKSSKKATSGVITSAMEYSDFLGLFSLYFGVFSGFFADILYKRC